MAVVFPEPDGPITASTRPSSSDDRAGVEVDPSSRGRVEGGHRDEGGDGVVARDLVVRREVGDDDGGERRTVGQRTGPLAAQPVGVVAGDGDPDGHAEHLHHDLGRRPLAAHGRHSRVADVGRVGRWYVVALLATYVAGLVVLVTRPWGWELNRLTVRLWVFFRSDVPIAPDRLGPEDYGVLLNVLLFVPFGVLLTLALRRPWWWVTTAAALVASTPHRAGAVALAGARRQLGRRRGQHRSARWSVRWPSACRREAERDQLVDQTEHVTPDLVRLDAPHAARPPRRSRRCEPPSARASHTTQAGPSRVVGGPCGSRVT